MMSAGLHDAVRVALEEHRFVATLGRTCSCGWFAKGDRSPAWRDHVADEIASALAGLAGLDR